MPFLLFVYKKVGYKHTVWQINHKQYENIFSHLMALVFYVKQ